MDPEKRIKQLEDILKNYSSKRHRTAELKCKYKIIGYKIALHDLDYRKDD